EDRSGLGPVATQTRPASTTAGPSSTSQGVRVFSNVSWIPADIMRSGQSEIASIQNDQGRTPVVVSSRKVAHTQRPIPSAARFHSTLGGAPGTVVAREEQLTVFSHES